MNDLETLLENLKEEHQPFVIFIKAFFSGTFIHPYQLPQITSILKERRVHVPEKEVFYLQGEDEFYAWMDEEDEEMLLNWNKELTALSSTTHRFIRDLRYLFSDIFKTETASHPTYPHAFSYLFRHYRVIGKVKIKQFRIDGPEDIKKLHALLFGKKENTYSLVDNEINTYLSDGSRYCIYHCAKEKEKEIEKAFHLYKKAVEQKPALSLTYEICLFQKLLRIHPFLDGNGRTLRMMLQIRLYQLGMKDIFKLSLDSLVKEYKDSCLSYSDIHILYKEKKRIIEYEDPVYYRDFVFFIHKLLLVGMKGLY